MKFQLNESEKQRIKELYGIQEQNWLTNWFDMIGDYFSPDEPEEKSQPVSTPSSSAYITPLLNPLVDHMKKYEEFVPFAYYDGRYPPVPANEDKSKKGTLTIGYGTTDPKHAKIGNKITEKVASDLLKNHLNTECKRCIESWKRDNNIKVLDRNIVLSLMDMIYVNGCTGFRRSNVATSLENENYKQAANNIKNGNWGNSSRRNDNVNKFFCKSGLCK
jgi:GH24 family phage-related lysozyme (muramidase)